VTIPSNTPAGTYYVIAKADADNAVPETQEPVLRRQIEEGDPSYWNKHENVLREALDYPEWCCVPAS